MADGSPASPRGPLRRLLHSLSGLAATLVEIGVAALLLLRRPGLGPWLCAGLLLSAGRRVAGELDRRRKEAHPRAG